MNALKQRNPLSESFLMQLTLDIEGTGLEDLLQNAQVSSSMMKGVVKIILFNVVADIPNVFSRAMWWVIMITYTARR